MNTVEIKILMLRKGLTQEALAEATEYAVSAVNKAINRGDGSDRLLKAIARVLEVELYELWPERFCKRKCEAA